MKPEIPPAIPALTPRARILFQGDSITDGNRGRNSDPNHILGHGYVFLIAARWGAAYPEKDWAFFNRGVSGNTVNDLEKRWQTDREFRAGLRRAFNIGASRKPTTQARATGAVRPLSRDWRRSSARRT